MKRTICFVTTVDFTIKVFLVDHFKAMYPHYDITVITNTKDINFLKPFGLDLKIISLSIERKISPVHDLVALFRLYSLFRKYKFDVVHSIMPKSGLLSMLAALFAGIPVRIHTFTGQVWATRKGVVRWCLKTADKLIAFCATQILVDSHSQRDFLIKEKVVSESKSHVIANGSICGVDTKRFSPNPEARMNLRKKLGIPETDIVFLFLGRLNRDKGLLDLTNAFLEVCKTHQNVYLVIVGTDEEDMKSKILSVCGPCADRVHFEDYTGVPERYMAAADVFCLPSYREGFGGVIIEAASTGIPSIGTRIYGITDAIEEGTTGLLYEPANVNELVVRMTQFIENTDLKNEMGERARKRAIRDFSKEIVVSGMLEYYESLLTTHHHSLLTGS
jgi:glycosyltransferase involved in cell wall biosynthesis